jgi:putative flippase GtrA
MAQQLHTGLPVVSPQLKQQSTRYLVIGVGCALLNNAILIGADMAGAHYVGGTLLTFATTIPLAYVAHAKWTFSATPSWRGLARFIAGSLSSLAAALSAVALLRGAMGLPMVVAAPLATVAMTLYNFVVARWAVVGSLRN